MKWVKMDRTGEKSKNNQKCNMEIVDYRNNKDIDILFNDYNIIIYNQPYSVFRSGEIRNPMYPSVNGVGFIGLGEYKSRINGKLTEQYKVWASLILRLYSDFHLGKQTCYKNCSVCNEWLNFQNFAKWYDDNKWGNNLKLIPDKDILIKNNKIYSPDTVLLVDQRINNLILNHDISRGKYPIGVCLDNKNNKKYVASCKAKEFKHKFLGRFDSPEEAFYVYKERKEYIIKKVADMYKEKYKDFPNKVYQALYNYKVEITD